MIEKINKFLDDVVESLLAMDREILILRLSVILFLIYGASNWALDIPLRILCILMLLNTSLLKNKVLWVFVAATFVLIHLQQWYYIDNHKYLITYWSLVCALSVFREDTTTFFRTNARLLLGLVFLYATFWKIAGWQFHDGSFLEFTLLTDARMMLPAVFAGGMSVEKMYMNYDLMSYFASHPGLAKEVVLAYSPEITRFSLALSYFTILIEGLLALSFLFAKQFFFKRIKDYLLMVFVLLTYFLLPVTGFGFVLIILGIAQTGEEDNRILIYYTVCLLILQFTLLPLEDIFLRFAS